MHSADLKMSAQASSADEARVSPLESAQARWVIGAAASALFFEVEEAQMNSTLVVGIALAGGMALSTLAIAQEAARPLAPTAHYHYHRHVHHHVLRHVKTEAAQPAPLHAYVPHTAPAPSTLPAIAPSPNVKRDEDGMSEDVNHCNMGCIGGNPN